MARGVQRVRDDLRGGCGGVRGPRVRGDAAVGGDHLHGGSGRGRGLGLTQVSGKRDWTTERKRAKARASNSKQPASFMKP